MSASTTTTAGVAKTEGHGPVLNLLTLHGDPAVARKNASAASKFRSTPKFRGTLGAAR